MNNWKKKINWRLMNTLSTISYRKSHLSSIKNYVVHLNYRITVTSCMHSCVWIRRKHFPAKRHSFKQYIEQRKNNNKNVLIRRRKCIQIIINTRQFYSLHNQWCKRSYFMADFRRCDIDTLDNATNDVKLKYILYYLRLNLNLNKTVTLIRW